jgi:hypothetical protein
MNARASRPVGRGGLLTGALVVAAAGWIGLGVGFAVDAERTFFAYLCAFFFALTIALGALCLVMIAHTAGARWFVVVRRLAETVMGSLPAFLVLFVPLLFGLEELYPWVPPLDGLGEHVQESVREKQAYLNVPFFVGRAVLYLVSWAALAAWLGRWSIRQDRAPERAPPLRAVRVSGAGLMIFGFTLTFASFDWVMSLDPSWFSTVFGAYVFAGGMVGGLGLMLVLTWAAARGGALHDAVSASHVHALGRLLLTFVVFWAYMAYSQGFLIWIANLPHEVPWYLARWEGGWMWVLLLLVFGHFALPFAVLLSRRLKRSAPAMAVVGGLLLAMHYVDVFWLVLPVLHREDALHWMDLPALAAVVGSAAAFSAWRLGGQPLVPRHDPRLAQALEYESP